MSKLSPVDLSFLLLESPTRQMHMTAYQVFRLPPQEKHNFIPRLLAAYRSGPVAKPFNRKLKWLDKGVASWETVEPDLRYHVRHIAVPAPGIDAVTFRDRLLPQQPPAGPLAAPVGVLHHRGAGGRPVRHHGEGPPRHDRRHGCAETVRPVHQPLPR